jgi:hypothetical protein
LRRALDGKGTLGERARKAEQGNATIRRILKGSQLPRRVKRKEIPHLRRGKILAEYFGCKPRIEPEDGKNVFWWKKVSLAGLRNPAFTSAVVGDLGLAELEAIVQKWCPQVKVAWDRMPWRIDQLYEAVMEARNDRERKARYAPANASTCRALRQLRVRGLLVPACDNGGLRLTPKGCKMARRLANTF